MPESRLRSSFSVACLRQRASNSHWLQCRFNTSSGGELSVKSAVGVLGYRFFTSLANAERLTLSSNVAVAVHDLAEA